MPIFIKKEEIWINLKLKKTLPFNSYCGMIKQYSGQVKNYGE